MSGLDTAEYQTPRRYSGTEPHAVHNGCVTWVIWLQLRFPMCGVRTIHLFRRGPVCDTARALASSKTIEFALCMDDAQISRSRNEWELASAEAHASKTLRPAAIEVQVWESSEKAWFPSKPISQCVDDR